MTHEQIFTEFVKHLSRQNCRSQFPGLDLCQYRAEKANGEVVKCAVGMFIPDEVYKPDMEGLSVSKLILSFEHILPPVIIENKDFLTEMQDLHDDLEGDVDLPWTEQGRIRVREDLYYFCGQHGFPDSIVTDNFPILTTSP